ncbi:5-methyltetrahydropteroyltriglutamate--homocysteine S-methyltransferase [bacterium]|nr:5-methyltetrahydropteroyltriglutamate--homocysteine S-methyltransferase [bacterium]
MQTAIQGFPRLGAERELKFALESFWKGEIDSAGLERRAAALRKQNYEFLAAAGLDLIPVGDFSFYDRMLDTAVMVGAVPPRFAGAAPGLELYFRMARGGATESGNIHPLSMLKWFNTNYHYLVPEFSHGESFRLADRTLLRLVDEALALGVKAMPALIGPVTFLRLGRSTDGVEPLALLEALLPVYEQVVAELAARGVEWIQLDEPWFAGEATERDRKALALACARLKSTAGNARLVVQTYFDSVGDNFAALAALPVDGLGLDFVHGPENLDLLEKHSLPKDKKLFAGVVDGRNIWVLDTEKALGLVDRLKALVGAERLVLASSCSLQHVPVTVEPERHLPEEVFNLLAFAREKVQELVALARTVDGNASAQDKARLDSAAAARKVSTISKLRVAPEVRSRVSGLTEASFSRGLPYDQRRPLQQKKLGLPLLPTTTIGSFPQTSDIRRLRARLRKGELTGAQYVEALRNDIRSLVKFQEEVGLDVLVHGEFERNDMVEYFGEQLGGYFFTRNGWVISYGSRGVKPPVIYGDIRRAAPMTVEWSAFAQSLTQRPMKGMLTGPVTMLNWSFVRDDISRREVTFQLALAIRDETVDLESAGIGVIQVDEPALREGLPLRKAKQADYLAWAVDAFRLTAAGVRPETQVHSHMCYSDFNTIIADIIRMDADVISIENSRAGGQLLKVFRDREYPSEIGPGIWDIHSPLVPEQEEIEHRLDEIAAVLPLERLWVNPDCGLKTRSWQEVTPSLRHMVDAAVSRRERAAHGGGGH